MHSNRCMLPMYFSIQRLLCTIQDTAIRHDYARLFKKIYIIACTIYKMWKINELSILKLWTLIKNVIESIHKFRYNILFIFLMDRGHAPNGIGHLNDINGKLDGGIFKSHCYLKGVATAFKNQYDVECISCWRRNFFLIWANLRDFATGALCELLLVCLFPVAFTFVSLWAMILLSMQLALFYLSTRFRCMLPITATDVIAAWGARSHKAQVRQKYKG